MAVCSRKVSSWKWIASAVALFILTTTIGCGSGSDLVTYPVEGTVRMKGEGVPRATVVLYKKAGNGYEVFNQAESDETGAFRFQTMIAPGKFQDGVVPGEYAVSLSRFDTSQMTSMTSPPKDLFPAKYTDPATSGLTATVAPGGTTTLSLEIK